VTTSSSLIDRVRLELGDQPSTFDVTVIGNGTATRYETGTYPLDGASVTITVDGTPELNAEIEERTGVVIFDVAPPVDSVVRFRGTKYRYFGAVDLQKFIDSAVAEHVHNRTDDFGRAMILANLPTVEEYPLSLLASAKALMALATDASFDIDIMAPDGVNIPRSERYRQLLEQYDARMAQYKDICSALNIGLWRIEVFNLRRVSKMSGRLIPIYIEREIDDNSPPVRANLPTNTYGSTPIPAAGGTYDISTKQGDVYAMTLDFDFDITNYTVKAQVRTFPQNAIVGAEFGITIIDAVTGVVMLSLSPTQTRNLPVKGYWDVQLTNNADATDIWTPLSGNIFVEREVTR
jgi:hypothetical protein